MKKEDQQILVVEKKILFQKKYFEGFVDTSFNDYYTTILNNYKYKKRGEAEIDENYKQPIPYIMLQDENNDVFVYQRAQKKKDYTEKRLYGKWSVGLGGHIDKEDSTGNDPVLRSALREINEEVSVNRISHIKKIGYINDDSNEVGRVHFGVVFLAKTEGDIAPKGSEIQDYKIIPTKQLNTSDLVYENWSKIIVSFLAKNQPSL